MSHQHNRMCAHPPRWTLVTSLPITLLLFCGAQCGSSLETVDLSAIELATVNKLADDNNYDAAYCMSLVPYGGFEGLKHGAANIGYYRNYDDGTDPLPCWWWVSSVDRGLVRFDLGANLGVPADRVVDATLEYDLHTTATADNCPDHILASLWIMNEPWSDKFNVNAELFTDIAPALSCIETHQSRNVTSVVRDWLGGVRPNYGFLFVGGDESLPANQRREHQTTLSNVKLKVLVAIPTAS